MRSVLTWGGASLLACMFISGCASILNDSTQTVNVATSTGSSINAKVGDQSVAVPGIVKLERDKEDKIFITDSEGCTKQTAVNSTVDMKFFINILSGGAFGSTTDYSTGRMWKYSDNVIINCNK